VDDGFFPKKIMRHLKEGSARCRAPLMADQLRDLLGMSPSRNCHEGGHPWLGRTRGMQLGYRDRLSCCDWLVDAIALTPADGALSAHLGRRFGRSKAIPRGRTGDKGSFL